MSDGQGCGPNQSEMAAASTQRLQRGAERKLPKTFTNYASTATEELRIRCVYTQGLSLCEQSRLADLFIAQGYHGVHAQGAACRKIARDKRHYGEHERDPKEGAGVARTDRKKLAGNDSREAERSGHTCEQSESGQEHCIASD